MQHFHTDLDLNIVAVFGANDQAHPAVWYLFNKAGDYYVGGAVEGIQIPPHYDFVDLRRAFLASFQISPDDSLGIRIV